MRVRLALLSILVASLLVAAAAPSQTRAQTIDLAAASSVAQQLSVLESQSAWNALYDQLHPDSQLTVDRATVTYWYQTYFAPNGPNPAQITGAALVSWTWPVTGRTYPQTAEIAYTQTFANGATVDEIVRLVPAADGSWRWFFGRSPEFIQQITLEAGQALDPLPIPDRTGVPPAQLFAEAIASITAVAPACFIAAGTSAAPTSIGFDSLSSNASESGARPEFISYMPAGGSGFPDLVINALVLANGETPETVARKIDASQLTWEGPPGSAAPRAFVADLAPASDYLITYYEEYSEATGYMPVLTWGPIGSNNLFTVVGPAAGLINGLVAEWSFNALTTCLA
ncbi:MAG: hypothetical protein R2848_15365 [Thermomicrobiales bacterium]